MTLRDFIKKYKSSEFLQEDIEFIIEKEISEGNFDLQLVVNFFFNFNKKKQDKLLSDISDATRFLHYRRLSAKGTIPDIWKDSEDRFMKKYEKR